MLEEKTEGTSALGCPIKEKGSGHGDTGQHGIQQGPRQGKLEMKI